MLRVFPISYNSYVKSQKYNNIQNSINFKANIPKEILAQQKYAGLLSSYRAYGNNFAYLYDSNILKSLQNLKDDNTVSNGFKAGLLLSNSNSYLISRVEDCKNTTDSRKADFDFDVVTALLMASPDDETTKKQLLTPRKHNGKPCGIPLHYANAKMANLLLCSSPDDETLKEQLLFKDEKGNIPFAKADEETKMVMLEACDNETKIKMLSDDSVLYSNDGDFDSSMITTAKSILDNEDFLKARALMLQARNPKNGRNILHSTKNNLDYVVKIAKRYPELLKTLLLEEDNEGNIPSEIQFQKDRNKAFLLLEASLDDETLSNQLFHLNNGKMLIDELRNDCCNPVLNSSVDVDNTIQKVMFYKNSQTWLPIIASLNSTTIINILNKINDPELKKEILLAKWEKELNGSKSTQYTISHTLHSDKYKEYIANNVLEVIQASSTSYNEALKLINKYKPCVDEISKETFEAIEKYITDNNLAEQN